MTRHLTWALALALALFVLLAGRWYTSPSFQGPWSYVSSANLPADFSRIPPDSPAGRVLVSVAGTPQAQAALLDNSIPQSARVPLVNGPRFDAHYTGPPQLSAIPGTPLQYVINAGAPTLRVDAQAWYALQAGIWFAAPSANGPWTIATLVPASIYAIPETSPIHHVTYARIHESTATEVYVGYTPGYIGAVQTRDGVVVDGTGYEHRAWIGSVYPARSPVPGVIEDQGEVDPCPNTASAGSGFR